MTALDLLLDLIVIAGWVVLFTAIYWLLVGRRLMARQRRKREARLQATLAEYAAAEETIAP